MSWNSDTQILSRKGGYHAVSKNGQGDLQIALRTSEMKKQNIFAYGVVNPFAKCKAFKSTRITFPNAAARDAERLLDLYGFTSRPQFLPATNTSNVWTYTRPTTPSYILRVDDFVHGDDDLLGYQRNAAPCFGITLGQLSKSGQSQILLWLDEKYNYCGRETNGRVWKKDTSLSMADLFDGYGSYYFAFLVIVGNTKNVILTKKTLSSVLNTDHGNTTIELYAAGDGTSNPSIPAISGATAGDTATIIAYLTGSSASGSLNYEVKTSDLDTYNGYSLALESGLDRIDGEIRGSDFYMDGVSMSGVTLNAVDTQMEMTDSNSAVWRAYILELSATFDTSSVHYSGTMRISGDAVFSITSGAGKYGATPDDADTPVTIPISTALAGGIAGQIKTITSQNYLWVLKQSGSVIQTTARAAVTYDTPMSGPAFWLTGVANSNINP